LPANELHLRQRCREQQTRQPGATGGQPAYEHAGTRRGGGAAPTYAGPRQRFAVAEMPARGA
jgi:hypothetical protein